jgi:hypothetical protein
MGTYASYSKYSTALLSKLSRVVPMKVLMAPAAGLVTNWVSSSRSSGWAVTCTNHPSPPAVPVITLLCWSCAAMLHY